jgi:hypothetical protein
MQPSWRSSAIIGGVSVRVYSMAKTIADCLKYRGKIGTRLAIQALGEGIAQGNCSRERLQFMPWRKILERIVCKPLALKVLKMWRRGGDSNPR